MSLLAWVVVGVYAALSISAFRFMIREITRWEGPHLSGGDLALDVVIAAAICVPGMPFITLYRLVAVSVRRRDASWDQVARAIGGTTRAERARLRERAVAEREREVARLERELGVAAPDRRDRLSRSIDDWGLRP